MDYNSVKHKEIVVELSIEQVESIDKGLPIWLEVQGRDCVLLSAQVYDRIRAAIEEWDPSTMQRHMADMMAEDWSDPAMNVYDE